MPLGPTTQVLTEAASSDSTADAGVASRVLQCSSESTGECAYVTTTTAINISPLAAEAPLAAFKGMWDHDPADGGHMADLRGYLFIEEPYVHVLPGCIGGEHGAVQRLDRDANGALQYSMLLLPRPGTRYNSQTRSLWVYDQGPMTDGDYVLVGGGEGHRPLAWGVGNVHERRLWRASSMRLAERAC